MKVGGGGGEGRNPQKTVSCGVTRGSEEKKAGTIPAGLAMQKFGGRGGEKLFLPLLRWKT